MRFMQLLQGVVAVTLVLGASQAFAEKPAPVEVTNTPLPVRVTNPSTNVDVAGSVNVNNSTTNPVPVMVENIAPVPVTGSVTVTATTPVPLSGSVTVANPTTFPNPLPVTVTNPSSSSGDVTVTNTTANPVPVTMRRGGVYVGRTSFGMYGMTYRQEPLVPVPTGPVVLQSVSGLCYDGTSRQIEYARIVVMPAAETGSYWFGAPFMIGAASEYGVRTIQTQPVNQYYDPASSRPPWIVVATFAAGPSGAFDCWFYVMGRYEDP